jgi:hypothetical protein
MSTDPFGTIPAFEMPEPVKRPAPRTAQKAGTTPPKWARYRPKNPVKCDHCMAVHVETGGRGPLAAMASFSRTAGGVRELLCYQHAQTQRVKDGLPRLRGGAK